MLEELKKPIEEILSKGKDVIENAGKESAESKAFFEKLSEKIYEYTGQTVVENAELKYNKNYTPEEETNE